MGNSDITASRLERATALKKDEDRDLTRCGASSSRKQPPSPQLLDVCLAPSLCSASKRNFSKFSSLSHRWLASLQNQSSKTKPTSQGSPSSSPARQGPFPSSSPTRLAPLPQASTRTLRAISKAAALEVHIISHLKAQSQPTTPPEAEDHAKSWRRWWIVKRDCLFGSRKPSKRVDQNMNQAAGSNQTLDC